MPAGAELGVPTVAEDGRTVRTTVVAGEPPRPADLDVVLSGQPLDEPPRVEPSAPRARWTAPDRELLGVDPGEPGPLATTSSDYTLPSIGLPGMAEPVEMVGHVVQPSDRAPSRPLVLFLHGRHSSCYDPDDEETESEWPCTGDYRPLPSHLGYRYVQQLLASQGYVTVSVAANGINAQDGELPDAGADARARLVRAHLDRWAAWVADGEEQVDLRHVVLVGHSRGGEGVARAALELPLTAPYRVAGQVLVAPTDFSHQATPYVPTVALLPSCDGDISDLQGQLYVDAGRDVVDEDTSLKSSVMAVGANHNYFNTEWTPGLSAAPSSDDWFSETGPCAQNAAARLDAVEQRRVGAAYIAGAVHLFASDDEAVLPMYDGSAVRVASTGDAVVLSHALGNRELRRPRLDASPLPGRGAKTRLCRGINGGGTSHCARLVDDAQATPHWPSVDPRTPWHWAFEMDWQAAGGTGGLSFARPLDLRGAASLDLRTVVDTRRGDVRLGVRVTDADGAVAEAPGTVLLPALPRGPWWYAGKYWAQTLRVDPDDLDGIDLATVTAVELVGRSPDGRIWVLDVAAVPPEPPEAPARRIPLVDLGQVRVPEGDAGARTAEVPYTVTGDLAEDGSFVVNAEDHSTGDRRTLTEEVAPGSTGGTIAWEYTGNDLHSLRAVHTLRGYALRNVMMRDHLGRVVVVDDDPAPRIRLRTLRRTVSEGRRAPWLVRLSEPVDHDLGVTLTAVRGRAPQVRVSDISPRWLERWTWNPFGGNPYLHRVEVGYYRTLPAGRTRARLVVPLRQDRRSEARESLTVRVRVFELRWRSDPATVFVRRGR
jgi:hypothetical protein